VSEKHISPPKVFLTGRPGIGKTTAIMRFLESLPARACQGFYTQELREGNRRVGFLAITLEGEQISLAHVRFPRRWAVGRYGVDIRAFEEQIVPTLDLAQGSPDLLVVDEIGKMECFSALFRKAVWQALESRAPVLGTVAMRGGPFIGQVRKRPDIQIIEVTRDNRDALPLVLATRFDAWWSFQDSAGTQEDRT